MILILQIIIVCIVFFIGASIGSFLSLVSERVFAGTSFITGRSRCTDCGHSLGVLDLIPVVNFIFLHGKCRYCNKKIPTMLCIAEIVLGFLYVLAYAQAQKFLLLDTNMFILYWGFLLFNISVFFYIALYDLKYYIIPDMLVYTLSAGYFILIVGICILNHFGVHVLYYANYTQFFFEHVITGIAVFLFFFCIYALTKGRGIGGGDVKLSFLIGILLGAKPTILFLYIAFFSGALISLILIATKIKSMKDAIPFGPFLSFGVIIALLYSGYILQTPFFSFISNIGSIF